MEKTADLIGAEGEGKDVSPACYNRCLCEALFLSLEDKLIDSECDISRHVPSTIGVSPN